MYIMLVHYKPHKKSEDSCHVCSLQNKAYGWKKDVKMQIHQNLDNATVNKPNSPTDSNITMNWPIATE